MRSAEAADIAQPSSWPFPRTPVSLRAFAAFGIAPMRENWEEECAAGHAVASGAFGLVEAASPVIADPPLLRLSATAAIRVLRSRRCVRPSSDAICRRRRVLRGFCAPNRRTAGLRGLSDCAALRAGISAQSHLVRSSSSGDAMKYPEFGSIQAIWSWTATQPGVFSAMTLSPSRSRSSVIAPSKVATPF